MAKITKKLIDIGANLTDPMFKGIYHSSQKHVNDFNNVLIRAQNWGVEKMIITGGSLQDSKDALTCASTNDSLYSTVGCHPTRCNEFLDYKDGPEAYFSELVKLALDNKDKVRALGEMGLDYDRLNFCPEGVQKKYFDMQLKMVEQVHLPLFLHNRNSTNDFIDILEQNRDRFSSTGGVVHSFDGNREDLDRILDLGFYVGINGCSLKTDQNLETAKVIPADRLMIETDCPWCEIKQSHASYKHIKTQPQRNKNATDASLPVKNRNEPSLLIQILEVLSSIRDDDIDSLAQQVYENTNKLFFSS